MAQIVGKIVKSKYPPKDTNVLWLDTKDDLLKAFTSSGWTKVFANTEINALRNAGYLFAGIATIDTNPEIPDAKVFYIANEKGKYTNFGGINVTEDNVVILYYDNTWHKLLTGIASQVKLSELEGEIQEKFEETDSPDLAHAIVDKDGRMIASIDKQGDVMIHSTLKSASGGVLIDEKVAESFKCVNAEDYISATIDAEGKIIEGINKDGTKYINRISSPTFSHYALRNNTIYVASSDCSDEEKESADFVCSGFHDELILKFAIMSCKPNDTLQFSSGRFMIDEIPKVTMGNGNIFYAVIYPNFFGANSLFDISVCGMGSRGENRTEFIIAPTAFDNIPSSDEGTFISWYTGIYQFSGLHLKDFRITLKTNQHKCCLIDMSHFGHGCVENLSLYVDEQTANPVEGCVGIRSYMGSDTGTQQIWSRIIVSTANKEYKGFYEAFQLGAEHHILMNCGSRRNVYGYTFGNYFYQQGTFDHPISLINCNDELDSNLPKFVRCGYYKDTPDTGWYVAEKPLQSVNFIACNIEYAGNNVALAEEVTKGAFCGKIEFTSGGDGYNRVDQRFWKDGSGHNFTTINLAHALGGSSAMRNTYAPNYMQQYYDTDLNMLLIYNGVNWVDVNGNIK